MRILGRRAMQVSVTQGEDRVISHYPLPPGGAVNQIFMEVHCIGQEEQNGNRLAAYGISGFVVPVVDVDAAANVNTIWDTLIPKDLDAGSGVLDLDTGAADATPEFELGELDLSSMFEIVPLKPREIFRRRSYITAAKRSLGYQQRDATVDTYTPSDYFKTTISPRSKVSWPAMVLFALSSPDMAQTTGTEPTAPSETEWLLYQIIEQAIEMMLMYVAGLTSEGTGTTPYNEASAFIAKLVENDVYEEDSGLWLAQSWTTFCISTYDVWVPGRKTIRTLSSE